MEAFSMGGMGRRALENNEQVNSNRDKNGKFIKGHKHSKESILKMTKFHLGKKHTEETKEKMRKNNARYWKGKNLSEETKKKLSISHTKGFTPILKHIRRKAENERWKKKCLKRAKYSCQICKRNNLDLHVHHIVPLNLIVKNVPILTAMDCMKYTKELYDVRNGLVVCVECHRALHGGERHEPWWT